ncbi:MAG: WD40 repeat domain-containing protein, partial [Alphaproteobacteria bacterium]
VGAWALTLPLLYGHTPIVVSAVLCGDGRSVLRGSGYDTARLWDAASGKTLQVLEGHTANVVSAVFSPDGRTVLTGSDDNTARLWQVDPFFLLSPREQVAAACERLARHGLSAFDDADMLQPIMQGRSRTPCDRAGLLSWRWWRGQAAAFRDRLFRMGRG